jgi:ubiquinone/menaquinone biosynthesis C-methylase UbiE
MTHNPQEPYGQGSFTDRRSLVLQYYGPDDRHNVRIDAARNVRVGGIAQIYEVALALMAPRAGEVVIDMGAGNGYFCRRINERGARAVPIDLSMHQCSRMARMSLRPVVAEATRLPFEDGCANAVVSMFCLYHVPRPRLALEESARVLRPGGRVVIGTKGHDTMPELWGWHTAALRAVGSVATCKRDEQSVSERTLPALIPHTLTVTGRAQVQARLAFDSADRMAAYVNTCAWSYQDVPPEARAAYLTALLQLASAYDYEVTRSEWAFVLHRSADWHPH